MNKNRVLTIMAVVAIVIIVWMVYSNDRNIKLDPTKEPVKIGAILPLSGNFSHVGEDGRNGLEVRLKEINDGNGVNGRPLEIIFEDSNSDTTGAVNAFRKLVTVDKVNVIIGGDATPGTLAVASLAEENDVLLVSYTSAARKVADFDEMVIKVRPDLENQSIRMSDFLLGENLKRVAVMVDSSNDAVVPAAEVFEEYFTKQGGEVIAKETFTSSTSDFRAQLLKIKNANPEAVWVASLGKTGGLILKQASELGFENVLFAGLSNWAVPEFIEAAGEFASNAIFTSEPFDCSDNTFNKYCSIYKEMNPDYGPSYYGGYAYDALGIVEEAMKKDRSGGFETSVLAKYIGEIKKFNGLMNDYDLTNNGKVSEGSYVIKTIKGQDFVPVE